MARRGPRRLAGAPSSDRTWRAHDRDPDILYRGARLEQGRQLLDRFNAEERAFVDASSAAERARDTDRRRAVRRLRRLVAGLVVLVLVAAGTAVLAVAAQRDATRARNSALSLRAADLADDPRATRPTDAAALALAAYRVAPTAEARTALVLADAAVRANEDPDNRLGQQVFPPGRVMITSDGVDETQLWTRDRPSGWRRAGRLPSTMFAYMVDTAENRVVTRLLDGDFMVWNIADPDAPRPLPLPPLPLVHGLDANGDVLGTVVGDEAVLWRSGTEVRLPATGVERAVPLSDGTGAVLFRRTGKRSDVELWTLDGTPHRTAVMMTADAPPKALTGPAGRVAVFNKTTSRLSIVDLTAPGHRSSTSPSPSPATARTPAKCPQ